MPVNPNLAIQPPANVLLERTFALAVEIYAGDGEGGGGGSPSRAH